jgi:hypothetical protein
MKTLSIILLFIFAGLFSVGVYAAFPVKTEGAAAGASACGDVVSAGGVRGLFYKKYCRKDMVKLLSDPGHKHGDGHGGGWWIAALVCGAFLIWPLAIVFGAIGMSNGRANHDIAKFALILGIIEGIIEILLIIVLILLLFSFLEHF